MFWKFDWMDSIVEIKRVRCLGEPRRPWHMMMMCVCINESVKGVMEVRWRMVRMVGSRGDARKQGMDGWR